VQSPAVERLARLGSLRELSLSHCLDFHGRSLAEVAKIPGLRRLELRGCATLSAADAMHLAKLRELRFLDLRDCQGRYRGQTAEVGEPGDSDPTDPGSATFVDTDGDGLPDARVVPPTQDGIGITDEVVAALAGLPLETLLLGGSESLTDAIGASFGKLSKLRTLDLSNLPKTTGALLAKVPNDLESLVLDDNRHLDGASLRRLPVLPHLRVLGLADLRLLIDADVRAVLAERSVRELRLGGCRDALRTFLENPRSRLTARVAAAIATQGQLEHLDLSRATWVDAEVLRAITTLPKLAQLDLTGTGIGTAAELAPLAASKTLRQLKLAWCRTLDGPGLAALAGAPLRELDLYGTNLKPDEIRELARAWPGCTITMPQGQRHRVP
jgi:hypothetical protein